MLSVGIDFGTSNSSAAVYDGTSVRLLPLDPYGRDQRVMRSLIYIERGGAMSFGQRALDLYLEQNTGRTVSYEMRKVGTIEMEFADVGSIVQDAYGLIDVSEPGRLFQSLKRFLTTQIGIGSKRQATPFLQEAASALSFQSTNVFGMDFRLEELLSLLAKEIVALTTAALGEPPTSVTVGWPVRFSEDPEAEELARNRLREAWRLATGTEVAFVEEPVAALHHFVRAEGASTDRYVLVFDFGGGTLDICVAELAGGRAIPLATRGVPIGGDLLDSRLVETRLAPLFGEYATYRRTGLPMPQHWFRRLQNWQTLNELSKPEYLSAMHRARIESDQPEAIARLEALVRRNYAVAFFRAVERTKIDLSERLESTLSLDEPALRISELITRSDLLVAIGPQVRAAQACILETVEAARLAPGQIELVVTTGGSSLIPAVKQMLVDTFPAARIEASDPLTSVAAGLARIGSSETS